MFKSLIVGVDGAPGDADAIALAQQLAEPGATLVLTGVVDSGPTGSRGANLDFDRVMRDDFAAVTRRLSDTLTGGSAQTEVIMAGTVAHGLLVAAERRHADLIVVGSSRRGALGRVIVGDDARAMVRIADRPVAVAPADYARHRGAIALIGAGYDGDDVAQDALETARRVARDVGARVRAVDVITAGHWPLDPIGMDVVPAIENNRKLADEAMQRATETLDGVDGCVRVGICHDELTDFAHEVDLLVVGAHHRGRLGRRFFGSTSEALTHDLACPLLVIPAHAAPVTAATSHKEQVVIRSVRPEDFAGVERLLKGLSIDARYRRWFTGAVDLSAAAQWAVHPPGGVALVALVDDEIVGHGALVPSTPNRAEVAFEVAKPWRRHGIATGLLHRLEHEARERGIETIEADVLALNNDMLAVFSEHGDCTKAPDGTLVHVTFPARTQQPHVLPTDAIDANPPMRGDQPGRTVSL